MTDVSIADLGDAVAEAMREYTEDVAAAIPSIVNDVTKAAVRELAARSPKDTGSYADGWQSKKVYSRTGYHGRVIHNETDYQLTHLLEFGHAKRKGGRVSARPHVAKVAEEFGARFTKSITDAIKNGGK